MKTSGEYLETSNDLKELSESLSPVISGLSFYEEKLRHPNSYISSYQKTRQQALDAITHASERMDMRDTQFVTYFEPELENEELTDETLEEYDRIFRNE